MTISCQKTMILRASIMKSMEFLQNLCQMLLISEINIIQWQTQHQAMIKISKLTQETFRGLVNQSIQDKEEGGCSSSISKIIFLRDRQIRTRGMLVKELRQALAQPQHQLDHREVVQEECRRCLNKRVSSKLQTSNSRIGSDNNSIQMHTLIFKESKKKLSSHNRRCNNNNQTNISNMAIQCNTNYQTQQTLVCNRCPSRATKCSKRQGICKEIRSTSSTNKDNKK